MLSFQAEGHIYRYNGQIVPSVTQILEQIDDLWRVPPAVLEASRQLGTAVHRASELDDLNDLDESSVSTQIAPYLDAWRRFRREVPWKIVGMEKRVFHPVHRYAGTYDRLFETPTGLALVDLKSGASYPSHGPQTAAYAEAHRAETGQHVAERYVLQVDGNGRYKLTRHADATDLPVFLSALTIYRYKQKWNIK